MAAMHDNSYQQSDPLAERRGIFRKLPPLSIPRRRPKTDAKSPVSRQDSFSAVSPTSASKAIASIGSALSKIGSNSPSPAQADRAHVGTPSPLQPKDAPVICLGFVRSPQVFPSFGTAHGGDVSPSSRPTLKRASSSHTGVLPDDSSDEEDSVDAALNAYSEDLQQVMQGATLADESEATAVFSQTASPTRKRSTTRPALKLDTSIPRVSSDPCEAHLSSPAVKSSLDTSAEADNALPAVPSPSNQTSASLTTSSLDWDPANPGHDVWRDISWDERQKHRNKVMSDMSSFNWRGALRRRKSPPAPSMSPRGSVADEPADVGNLTAKGDTSTLKPQRPSGPIAAPSDLSADFKLSHKPMTRTTKSGSIVRDFALERDTLPTEPDYDSSISSSASRTTELENNTPTQNSPFSTFYEETIPSPEEEEEGEEEEEEEEELPAPIPPLASPIPREEKPHPTVPLLPHEIFSSSPPPPSSSGEDNPFSVPPQDKPSKHKRSPTQTTQELTQIRSRGESIGLPDITTDRHVLAAGYEVFQRGVFRSTGYGKKFQLCENRGPSGKQRVLFSVDETAEGNNGSGKGKGRWRGETV